MRRKNTKTNYLLEKIASLLANEKRGKLLDLGCGDGDYSFRLKEPGFDVIAADLDEKGLNTAVKLISRYAMSPPNPCLFPMKPLIM